eukprot:m.35805 g.35805  ORF g.35805 m.35805 type:complete len:464 (+) comp10049_c0_seq2:111-1502(+)
MFALLPCRSGLFRTSAVFSRSTSTRFFSTPSQSRLEIGKDRKDVRQRSGVTNELWNARTNVQMKPLTDEDFSKEYKVYEKTMKDSYVDVYLPFSTSAALQEEYLTYTGTVRVGKILEDLDALAGTIAYHHCDDNDPDTPPLTIVTASVDRITLLQPMHTDTDPIVGTTNLKPSIQRDYRMHGSVTSVGRSSMRIDVTVDTPHISGEPISACSANGYDKILEATFEMVARDPRTNKAAPINQLIAENDVEQEKMRVVQFERQQQMKRRKEKRENLPPTAEERIVLHDLYVNTNAFTKLPTDRKAMWMDETEKQSLRMCHPIERNIHNSIFGGYLMREAFELAWMTADIIAEEHPIFLSVDDISFKYPVEIGSILQLSSVVTYTGGDKSRAMQVAVDAEIINPNTGETKLTNSFNFTFATPSKTVTVLPRTYAEGMRYLEGRRLYQNASNHCKENCPDLMKYYER